MSEIKSPPPSWYEPPEDVEMVCPDCGTTRDSIPELEAEGLGAVGLLAYPLYTVVYETHDDTTGKREPIGGGLTKARENAHFLSIMKCACGWIGVDDALVSARGFFEP